MSALLFTLVCIWRPLLLVCSISGRGLTWGGVDLETSTSVQRHRYNERYQWVTDVTLTSTEIPFLWVNVSFIKSHSVVTPCHQIWNSSSFSTLLWLAVDVSKNIYSPHICICHTCSCLSSTEDTGKLIAALKQHLVVEGFQCKLRVSGSVHGTDLFLISWVLS